MSSRDLPPPTGFPTALILSYGGVVAIWSTTPLAIKWSAEGAGFLFAVTARMAIGTAVCLLLLAVLRTPLPRHRRALATYGAAALGIYGAMICVYWAARLVPSGLISVLFGLTPILTALLAALLLRESRLRPLQWIGIALALAGLGLIFRSDLRTGEGAAAGIAAILAATLLHSLSTVWVKRAGAGLSALQVNSGGLLLALLAYGLTWVWTGAQWPTGIPPRAAWAIVYLGVLGTVVGFSLYFHTVRHLPTRVVALIPLITPVAALLLGIALNGEQVGPRVWSGTLLIGLGLIAHTRAEPALRK